MPTYPDDVIARLDWIESKTKVCHGPRPSREIGADCVYGHPADNAAFDQGSPPQTRLAVGGGSKARAHAGCGEHPAVATNLPPHRIRVVTEVMSAVGLARVFFWSALLLLDFAIDP